MSSHHEMKINYREGINLYTDSLLGVAKASSKCNKKQRKTKFWIDEYKKKTTNAKSMVAELAKLPGDGNVEVMEYYMGWL